MSNAATPIDSKKPASSSADQSCPDAIFARLQKHVDAYIPSHDSEVLQKAYEFAAHHHRHQKRKSGEPYITHPLEVADILTSLRLDIHSITAAILHDTVEDTEATVEDITREFGPQVAELVDGLTKISRIKFRSTQEKLAENFRKMIVAMAKDLRVILIKLGDRLHNMRTIGHMPMEKAVRIADETLEIYAPLANRLGIYGIKSELEDLCLRVRKADIYQEIRTKVAKKKAERQAYIDDVVRILDTELKKFGFKDAEVKGRPKHFYSIYKKMVDRQLEFDDIHDLFAFRITVDSLKDCYEALGIVHAMWKPMPGRFKDYIAMPKANMYQSLHTTVIRPNGEPCEIQIRTKKMNEVCEYGVASHWSYKERNENALGQEDLKKFSWLRQIVQWQSELQDPNEFLEAVKVDLFDEEIFVFTPKGDVISLPSGASALDFAFAVHTDVGLRTIGTKVNGRMVPIKKGLKSGDIVEILTSANQNPRKDWLNFVQTSKARNKIRSYLRADQRQRSYDIGTELLVKELEKIGITLEDVKKHGQEDNFVKASRESKFDDMLIAIGYGKINVEDVVAKVYPEKVRSLDETPPEFEKKRQKTPKKSSTGVLVSGLDNVLVNFAKCCNPLPGEEICGFITRGRGVTVHRSSCPRALDADPARQIEVSWASEEGKQSFHKVHVRILTKDRPGILADVTGAISACGSNVIKADIRVNKDLLGVLDFELGTSGMKQFSAIVAKIESINGVISCKRLTALQKKGDKK